MFNNIGGKIKGLAKFCAYACVICGVIVALIGLSIYGGAGYGYDILTEAGNKAYMGLQMLKYGLIAAVAGFLSAWPLYGFGELIEKVSFIADNLKKEDK